jgi:hypothetical protein
MKVLTGRGHLAITTSTTRTTSISSICLTAQLYYTANTSAAWLPHRLSDVGWRRRNIGELLVGTKAHQRSLPSIPPRYNNIPCCGERLLPRFTRVRDIIPPAISISIGILVSFGIRNPHCHAFSPPPPCSDHDHEPDSQARRPLEARRAQRGQRLATRG